MYKVIIVDDEKLLRQGFIHMTDWSQHLFEIVGEASHGIEALTLIEQVMPDIVVTDIRMPRMDGVELTRIIKENYKHVEVIVLSSYNDFDYVKQTLLLGAVDYILKPKMQYSDLLNALERARDKIIQLRASTPDHEPEALLQPPVGSYSAFYEVEDDRLELYVGSVLWDNKTFQPLIDIMESGTLGELMHTTLQQYASNGQYAEPNRLKKFAMEICCYIFHRFSELGVNMEALDLKKSALLIKMDDAHTYRQLSSVIREVTRELELAWRQCPAGQNSMIRIITYIHEHYGSAITLDSMAQQFHFNKSYFCQLFKKHTGDNFHAYLMKLRMDRAKVLLRNPEVSIYDVSRDVGFSNVSYFSKLFKRTVGTTPSGYYEQYIKLNR